MSELNKVILIGHLVRDPEIRHTQTGASVCNFSIASNHGYVADGEKKQTASFFNCIAWAKLGETIREYLSKGSQVAIEGRLQQRSWEDQKGNKRSTVEIVVEKVQFLGGKGEKKESPVADAGNDSGIYEEDEGLF